MGLLDKFDAIEIKSDTRISSADRRVCQTYQDAYDKGRAALKHLGTLAKQYCDEQEDILGQINETVYATFLGNCIKTSDIYEQLQKSHGVLINWIVSYFESHYNVSIEEQDIVDVLLPKRPDRYRDAEWLEYNDKMNDLELNYESVLDQIFIQLGGFSFQEKALNELREKCHCAAWNTYQGYKEYEQKKAVVSFTRYMCHYDSRYSTPYINLSDSMKNVIRAAAYFEYGVGYEGACHLGAFRKILGYSLDVWEFDFDLEKIKGVKCFKNGRVDLRFTSEAYARQFVEEFLGSEV